MQMYLDCDYFSVRVRVEALEQFGTLFQVSCRGVSQVKDRRGENLILLTMPPVVVLFEEGKDRVIESVRRNGGMVVPNRTLS